MGEARVAAQRGVALRGQSQRVLEHHARRSAREHDGAIGQERGLGDRVRDEEHRHPRRRPQRAELVVELLARDLVDRGEERNAIAYVFQDAHLLPWRSVQDNAALPLELLGRDAGERREAARRAIEQVGLGDAAHRFPAQLSGGMRMRVSLARALVTEPRLLLLDEPFAALDEITRQQLDDQLRALWRATGMTVLFVTHSIAEAAFLAERAVVLTRRPARVVLEHRIDLPSERDAALRGDPRFARETRILYEALARGNEGGA